MKKETKNIVEFTLIYNRYKVGIYNYVLRMLNDDMQSEDVVQTVFLKMFENFDSIRDKNSIKYWLYTTTRNEVYTFFRKENIKKEDVTDFDGDENLIGSNLHIIDEIELKEVKGILQKELKKLPVEQREVYLLKEYAGLTYKEIARISGISEKLVKSRLFKARQKLIKQISKLI